MTLWMIPSDGGKRLRLIDRSFRPAFYVHGAEARLRCLAQQLASRAAGSAACARTETTTIWEPHSLVVLEGTAHHPTEFRKLAC